MHIPHILRDILIGYGVLILVSAACTAIEAIWLMRIKDENPDQDYDNDDWAA